MATRPLVLTTALLLAAGCYSSPDEIPVSPTFERDAITNSAVDIRHPPPRPAVELASAWKVRVGTEVRGYVRTLEARLGDLRYDYHEVYNLDWELVGSIGDRGHTFELSQQGRPRRRRADTRAPAACRTAAP
jgi:hypothetical protein